MDWISSWLFPQSLNGELSSEVPAGVICTEEEHNAYILMNEMDRGWLMAT